MSGSLSSRAWWVGLYLVTTACGNVSEPVIERVVPRAPPSSTHRVDVFLVTSVAACAIGMPCIDADPERCFYVQTPARAAYFEPDGFDFVPVADPRTDGAEQVACFDLELGSDEQERATLAFRDLRSAVFELSQGNVDLDLRVHLVTPESASFRSWGSGGIFLQPDALSSVAHPLMNPESDFTFAVTGEVGNTGSLPKIDACGGTNWQARGGLGGAGYTWLSTSCLVTSTLQWHLLYQAAFAMRDVVGVTTPEVDSYPACGAAAANPQQWFPRPEDCSTDPDAATCGDPTCDSESFAAHIFEAHWPTGTGLIGNHCRNGRLDYNETAADAGGVCDELGR